MKILACIPTPQSATSFYRGIGPLQEMAKYGIEVTHTDAISWVNLGFSDVYFHQRPSSSNEFNALLYAKKMGVYTWVDYDDNLFEIPISNSNWAHYSKPEIQKALIGICNLVDLITVSTEELKNIILEKTKCGPKVFVVPNARTIMHRHNDSDKKAQIVWRGGSTHVADLLAYKDQIKAVAQANKHWTWLFLGDFPWALDDALKGCEVTVKSAPDTPSFLDLVSNVQSAIAIVPLEFNSFNKCKSNIAEIEFNRNAFTLCS
jgi:hypothetical protein